MLTTDPHLALRSGMMGATPLFPCTLSWCREGQLLLQESLMSKAFQIDCQVFFDNSIVKPTRCTNASNYFILE